MRSEEELRRMLRITELSIKRVERQIVERVAPNPTYVDDLVGYRLLLANQQQTIKWVLDEVPSNFASDQAELDRLEERAAMEGIR